MTVTALPERLVESSARGLTRRRVLRNAGGIGLGAAVATAFLGRNAKLAHACDYSGPCGPSPLCGTFRCNGYRCDTNYASWARWESGPAPCLGNSGVNNCWEESGYRCCDCCAYNPGCQHTPCVYLSCGHNTWQCICRGRP
jgi:hypothetical protein